jgi:hypothetical protein
MMTTEKEKGKTELKRKWGREYKSARFEGAETKTTNTLKKNYTSHT